MNKDTRLTHLICSQKSTFALFIKNIDFLNNSISQE